LIHIHRSFVSAFFNVADANKVEIHVEKCDSKGGKNTY